MDLAWVESHRNATDRGSLALAPGEHLLAGGTWLFSVSTPEVTGLVDLTTAGWPPWEPLPDGGLRLAATCTVAQARQAPWPDPVLAGQCADALLMSSKVAAAATVGGNICLGLPAGAMTALTAALDGEAVLWTPDGGERRTPVAAFVTGAQTVDLRPGEVLRAVDLPGAALRAPTAFGRASLTSHGRSAALVIGRRDPDAVVLTLTAAVPRPVVLTLPPEPDERAVRDAVADAGAAVGWYADVHGAPDWRAAQTARLAVEVCAELAGVAA
ncbi:FAD binding domain-containing protein [Modestobacter roseus]|uniref:CO/xanthine dehydrogenase FAD-binding subunit n=1 Tax=Modestobacter roseus TaxID=1181884 RepID=A0A562IPX8_9ACTN|nr:FAD binding domain-containing protein [Modestobacter roseus]MQA34313.1 FAD-binding molybdopterin dehydrogenase [Modestobacter roseus]TWH72968.1 CO/xanthine dehydrogenase FAD-binding subunit [Modestobacter roseus]